MPRTFGIQEWDSCEVLHGGGKVLAHVDGTVGCKKGHAGGRCTEMIHRAVRHHTGLSAIPNVNDKSEFTNGLGNDVSIDRDQQSVQLFGPVQGMVGAGCRLAVATEIIPKDSVRKDCAAWSIYIDKEAGKDAHQIPEKIDGEPHEQLAAIRAELLAETDVALGRNNLICVLGILMVLYQNPVDPSVLKSKFVFPGHPLLGFDEARWNKTDWVAEGLPTWRTALSNAGVDLGPLNPDTKADG